MFWGSFQKYFFQSFFDFWVSVRQVRADFHLVEIIWHMTCMYFSESSKGSADAYAIYKKSYVTQFFYLASNTIAKVVRQSATDICDSQASAPTLMYSKLFVLCYFSIFQYTHC